MDNDSSTEPDEFNLYLGFMIPIGSILVLCIFCLIVVSIQIMWPEWSNKHCPTCLLNAPQTLAIDEHPYQRAPTTATSRTAHGASSGRRTSLTVVRRNSDEPPSYDTLQQPPPSYNSVVIIESETPGSEENGRKPSIQRYIYDPSRRVSIQVHDEETIRIVEELLSRQSIDQSRSSITNSLESGGRASRLGSSGILYSPPTVSSSSRQQTTNRRSSLSFSSSGMI